MFKESKYYNGKNGCKIAVDLYRPEDSDTQMPVVLNVAYAPRKERFERYNDFVKLLIDKGYAAAFSDPRGAGASYGTHEGFYGLIDAEDYELVINEIAAEPWCSGSVGMFGGSNSGFIQLLTASRKPEALKAIIPCDASVDMYYQNNVNGACDIPPGNARGSSSLAASFADDLLVDEESAKELLKQHSDNLPFLGQYRRNVYRDTVNENIGYAPYAEISPWNRMDDLKYSGISTFYNAAWYDPGVTWSVIAQKDTGGRQVIGPWKHTEIFSQKNTESGTYFDWKQSYLDFFDSTLKNTESHASTQPPVRYLTVNEDPGFEWKFAANWPVDGQRWTEFFFDSNLSMSDAPPSETASIGYCPDDSVEMMGFGRMNRNLGAEFGSQSTKCMGFIGPELSTDLEITGIPVVDIQVTSNSRDGLFIAVLEDVRKDGSSVYITDGAIRASHGKIHQNRSWDALGIPYHRGCEEDAVELSADKPVNLKFNLEAISYRIRRGSRLRLSVFCGSANTYHQPEGMPEDVMIKLYTGGAAGSRLILPYTAEGNYTFSGNMSSDSPELIPSGDTELLVFEKEIYLKTAACWKCFRCSQVYPEGDVKIYETEHFRLKKYTESGLVKIKIDEPWLKFESASEKVLQAPGFKNVSQEIPDYSGCRKSSEIDDEKYIYIKNLNFATVPVRRGKRGYPNLQPVEKMDLFIDLIKPENPEIAKTDAVYPCIVWIHGYGGSNHLFHNTCGRFLEEGYAVASIDYRIYPPNLWPAPAVDAKGAIRYLKANSGSLGLDPERFGIIGVSAGGHLSAYLAATNGSPATEGNIGGNTGTDSSVKAAAIYYPWSDMFSFGDDIAELYPDKPEKVDDSDGPIAPPACLIGFDGEGLGLEVLKKHMADDDEYFQKFIRIGKDASPLYQVTCKSAPSVFVHGITENNIQIPMNQSVRMFRALTKKGVKSLMFCNNNGNYGDDPEVKEAVIQFMKNRI